MKLLPGFENEYKIRHDNIWPELSILLKKNGISNYSIFLDPDTLDLIGIMDVEHPASLDNLPHDPIIKKWWAYMADIMETNADHSPVSKSLQEVFFIK